MHANNELVYTWWFKLGDTLVLTMYQIFDRRIKHWYPRNCQKSMWCKMGHTHRTISLQKTKAIPKMLSNFSFLALATSFLSTNFLYSEQFLDWKFPEIFRVLFEDHTNISFYFQTFSEIFWSLTKFAEDFRESSEDISTSFSPEKFVNGSLPTHYYWQLHCT